MKDAMLKLQILMRSEMALSRIHVGRATTRMSLMVVAIVFVLLGLCMLNYSVFSMLSVSMSEAMAAFLVSLGDLLLALIIVIFARFTKTHGAEEQMAKEIRGLAYDELTSDVKSVRDDVKSVCTLLSAVVGGVSALKKKKE